MRRPAPTNLPKKPRNSVMNSSLITRSTTASLETVAVRLPEIAKQHKFGVLGIHDLKEKMTSKGVPARSCSGLDQTTVSMRQA